MALSDVMALYKIQVEPLNFGKSQSQQISQRLAQMKNINKIFQIGFNTGHQTEMILQSAKHVQWLVSCDESNFEYSEKITNYLSCLFPHKFQFVEGNSSKVMTLHSKLIEYIKFDLIFFGAKKNSQRMMADILESKQIAHQGTTLWIDNYQNDEVKKACDHLIFLNQIQITQTFHSQDDDGQIWVEAQFTGDR